MAKKISSSDLADLVSNALLGNKRRINESYILNDVIWNGRIGSDGDYILSAYGQLNLPVFLEEDIWTKKEGTGNITFWSKFSQGEIKRSSWDLGDHYFGSCDVYIGDAPTRVIPYKGYSNPLLNQRRLLERAEQRRLDTDLLSNADCIVTGCSIGGPHSPLDLLINHHIPTFLRIHAHTLIDTAKTDRIRGIRTSYIDFDSSMPSCI